MTRKVIELTTTNQYSRNLKEEHVSLFTNEEWQTIIESLDVAMEVWGYEIYDNQLTTGLFLKLQTIKQHIRSIEFKKSKSHNED